MFKFAFPGRTNCQFKLISEMLSKHILNKPISELIFDINCGFRLSHINKMYSLPKIGLY